MENEEYFGIVKLAVMEKIDELLKEPKNDAPKNVHERAQERDRERRGWLLL